LCVACSKKNTTLPDYTIPGDNYCNATATNEVILRQLYAELGGPNWLNHQNWLSGDYCTWYGISCNQNRDVVAINLPGNNLQGTQIPPSIGCFTYLKSLDFDNNNISGSLPQNFCLLKNIQYLTISNNNIGGSIPFCFKNLIFLEHLYLSYNGLIGELPDFSNFAYIKEVRVENNCIHGQVPQSIPSRVIVDLNFSNNYFSGCIPDFYSTLLVYFSGNIQFCTQGYVPCFLTDAALGCPITLRRNTTGTFPYCPGSTCLRI